MFALFPNELAFFGGWKHVVILGFLLAIPGIKPGAFPYLHSHMLGVLPDYRNLAIGQRLKLRQRMLIELDLIHDDVGITFLYVTHDQAEAMSLSDRIAVMDAGRIEQVGTPAEIYESPRTSFVAAFIGDTNFFEGEVAEIVDGEWSRLRIEGFPDVLCFNDKQIGQGRAVSLSLRPEKLRGWREKPEADGRHNVVPGRVEDVIYLGSHMKNGVRAGGHRHTVFAAHTHTHATGV